MKKEKQSSDERKQEFLNLYKLLKTDKDELQQKGQTMPTEYQEKKSYHFIKHLWALLRYLRDWVTIVEQVPTAE